MRNNQPITSHKTAFIPQIMSALDILILRVTECKVAVAKVERTQATPNLNNLSARLTEVLDQLETSMTHLDEARISNNGLSRTIPPSPYPIEPIENTKIQAK